MKYFLILSLAGAFLFSCSSKKGEVKDEQLRVELSESDSEAPRDTINSIQGNATFSQLGTYPQSVVLTGLPDHRLITVYKERPTKNNSSNKKL